MNSGLKFLVAGFLGIGILTSCQQGKNQETQQAYRDYVVIAGKVSNPQKDHLSLKIQQVNQPKTTIQLDKNNTFHHTLNLEKPAYLRLVHGGEYTVAYARPSDSIYLSLNTESFDESLTYSGSAADINNYLASKIRLSDSVDLSRKALRSLFSKKPDAFVNTLDSVKYIYLNHLSEALAGTNTKQFQRLERINIKNKFNQRKLQYPRVHRRLADDPAEEIPDDLDQFVNDLPFDDPLLARVPNYINLTRPIIRKAKQATLENNPELKDTADTYLTMRVMDSLVKNDTLKARIASKLLNFRIKRSSLEEVKPFYDYYRELAYKPHTKQRIDSLMSVKKSLQKGNEAPGFSYPSHDGDTVSLADLRGQYVYIDAWATWCGPCIREIPKLKELHNDMKDKNIAFVSISLDKPKDKGKWKSMVDNKNLKGYQLYANGKAFQSKLASDYMINSIPRFILINPEGEIIDANAERPSGDIKARLEGLLAEDGMST